jgi:hypothetical protein
MQGNIENLTTEISQAEKKWKHFAPLTRLAFYQNLNAISHLKMGTPLSVLIYFDSAIHSCLDSPDFEQFLARSLRSIEYAVKCTVTDELLTAKALLPSLSMALFGDSLRGFVGTLDEELFSDPLRMP